MIRAHPLIRPERGKAFLPAAWGGRAASLHMARQKTACSQTRLRTCQVLRAGACGRMRPVPSGPGPAGASPGLYLGVQAAGRRHAFLFCVPPCYSIGRLERYYPSAAQTFCRHHAATFDFKKYSTLGTLRLTHKTTKSRSRHIWKRPDAPSGTPDRMVRGRQVNLDIPIPHWHSLQVRRRLVGGRPGHAAQAERRPRAAIGLQAYWSARGSRLTQYNVETNLILCSICSAELACLPGGTALCEPLGLPLAACLAASCTGMVQTLNVKIEHKR